MLQRLIPFQNGSTLAMPGSRRIPYKPGDALLDRQYGVTEYVITDQTLLNGIPHFAITEKRFGGDRRATWLSSYGIDCGFKRKTPAKRPEHRA